MAILPSRPGIKITVECNGAHLQEYDDDDADEDDLVVSKYIEAISGAEFSVEAKITAPWPPYTILLEYCLDRKKLSGKYCRQESYLHPAYIVCKKGASTVVKGQDFLHKFAFSALTVEATVTDHDKYNKIKEVGKIPEKALKGRTLSHQISLRAPRALGKAVPPVTCEFVDPEKRHFAKYVFKYRSRDAPKSLLIIPRSPDPVPLEERDAETLNVEEMRELLRRQRERDAAARAVKTERDIKREHELERSGTLADDDDEISVVSSKRRRESYRTTVNEDGVESIDLT